jgi:hypothetical protein
MQVHEIGAIGIAQMQATIETGAGIDMMRTKMTDAMLGTALARVGNRVQGGDITALVCGQTVIEICTKAQETAMRVGIGKARGKGEVTEIEEKNTADIVQPEDTTTMILITVPTGGKDETGTITVAATIARKNLPAIPAPAIEQADTRMTPTDRVTTQTSAIILQAQNDAVAETRGLYRLLENRTISGEGTRGKRIATVRDTKMIKETWTEMLADRPGVAKGEGRDHARVRGLYPARRRPKKLEPISMTSPVHHHILQENLPLV